MKKYLITPVLGSCSSETIIEQKLVLPDLCISARSRDAAIDKAFDILLAEYCPEGAETLDSEDFDIESWVETYDNDFNPTTWRYLDLRDADVAVQEAVG